MSRNIFELKLNCGQNVYYYELANLLRQLKLIKKFNLTNLKIGKNDISDLLLAISNLQNIYYLYISVYAKFIRKNDIIFKNNLQAILKCVEILIHLQYFKFNFEALYNS